MCVFTVSEYRFGFDLGRFKMIDLIQAVQLSFLSNGFSPFGRAAFACEICEGDYILYIQGVCILYSKALVKKRPLDLHTV